MNHQICKLLKMIVDSKGPLQLKNIADEFKLSERSIRNYYNEIEKFLSKNGLGDVLRFQNLSFRYIGDEKSIKKIYNLLFNLNFYEYYLSSKEREDLIILILLVQDMPLKSSQLEELLFVSKTTLVNTMENVREKLKGYSVGFSRNKHYGLVLDCDEKKRRDVLFYILKDMGLSETFPWETFIPNACSGFISKFLKIDKYRYKIERSLQSAENQFHLNMNDTCFYEMTLVLCVIFFRIENNHYISYEKCQDYLEGSFEPNGLVINLCEYIYKNLFDNYFYNENEVQYLACKLCKMQFIMESSNKGQYANFHIIVKSLLYQLSKVYNINLLTDYKLHEYLTGHILSVFHRIKDGNYLVNPFKNELIEEYYEDFTILKNNIYILENGLACKFSDDEISYILMHILTALIKNSKKYNKIDVIISCNAGIGTSEFLATLVKKNFNVNIVAVTSAHSLKAFLLRQRCDLIISTVPLNEINIPWVQVNTVLSKDDFSNIRESIDKISTKSVKNFNNTPINDSDIFSGGTSDEDNSSKETSIRFLNMIKSDYILLDKEADNWQEAIITCAEPLLWDKKIIPNYLTAMVNVVLENGPYIVFAPGVALAHANPDCGVLEPGASFLRLKNTVDFGHETNDPVKFIIAVAINDTPEYINALFHIMNIMCNQRVLDNLSLAKNSFEIINILNEYEKITQDLYQNDLS
ncbi:BglG family transcription antiterminator [Anaerofustis stercorihominis]|uniref:BglG family transcription antiterminator n=1 Tax=Anaerofustis stercorihominis TaxID=214853 RepID=UPI00399244D9